MSPSKNFNKKGNSGDISDILGKVLGHKKVQEKAKSFSFITSWDTVVGEAFSKVSNPDKLVNGILTVKVIDAVYVQELSMHKVQFLEKLVELGYSGAVSDIKFISSNPKQFR